MRALPRHDGMGEGVGVLPHLGRQTIGSTCAGRSRARPAQHAEYAAAPRRVAVALNPRHAGVRPAFGQRRRGGVARGRIVPCDRCSAAAMAGGAPSWGEARRQLKEGELPSRRNAAVIARRAPPGAALPSVSGNGRPSAAGIVGENRRIACSPRLLRPMTRGLMLAAQEERGKRARPERARPRGQR